MRTVPPRPGPMKRDIHNDLSSVWNIRLAAFCQGLRESLPSAKQFETEWREAMARTPIAPPPPRPVLGRYYGKPIYDPEEWLRILSAEDVRVDSTLGNIPVISAIPLKAPAVANGCHYCNTPVHDFNVACPSCGGNPGRMTTEHTREPATPAPQIYTK